MGVAWSEVAGGRWQVAGVGDERRRAVERMVGTGFSSLVTTSAGRLFDAMAALAGLRTTVTYEGQAAIELEAAYDPGVDGSYEIALLDGETLVLDPRDAVLRAAAEPSAAVIASAQGQRAGSRRCRRRPVWTSRPGIVNSLRRNVDAVARSRSGPAS